MTDITDQDRRAARAWAKNWQGDLDADTSAAARVILATVDATDPTLAEELARIAENSPVWTIKNVRDELKSAADRAEQMERDLEEARAEVERLNREQGRLNAQVQGLARRDGDHNSEVRMLTEERDEARAEVERLTAERTSKESLPVELPDPADVKPGEAWIVEVEGERRTAVKDSDDYDPWNTFTADGLFFPEDNEDITLVTRLVPAPRVITNRDELDQAKRLTVIHDGVGVVCERASLGDEWFTIGNSVDQTTYIELPATVLWEPEA